MALEFFLVEGSRITPFTYHHLRIKMNFDITSLDRSQFPVFQSNFVDEDAVTFIWEFWLLLVDVVVFTMSHNLSVTKSDFTSGHKLGLLDIETKENFFSCFT